MIHAENERSFDAALRGMAYPLTVDPFVPGFIHDFKHGISAISNHSVPLLSMKEHISRPRSAKGRWGVRRAHDPPLHQLQHNAREITEN